VSLPAHAREGVVARAAGQQIGGGIAGEHVVIGRAGDILHGRQAVALGIAAGVDVVV
jgi:hypothetical protein